MHHRTKFREDWSNRSGASNCFCIPNFVEIDQTAAEIWRFFNFLRWRPSAILDFQKLQILTSDLIRRPNMRQCTKCREDPSNRSGDIADFRFFKWRLPPSWILEISNF